MIIEILKPLYRRDLEKLKLEIELYKNEDSMWKTDGDITNSAGNLCLHLVGNLNHFLGAILGQSGYVRDRDLEFSAGGVSRDELLAKVDDTIGVVERALDNVSDEQLNEDYPIVVFSDKMSTGYFLIHLTTHFAYHLGQVNYHRRIFDGADASTE